MRSKVRFAIAAVVLILTAAPAGSQAVTPIEFPGAAHTRPHGINSSGEISGIYVNPDNSVHSFLFDRNGFTTIDVPGAIGTHKGTSWASIGISLAETTAFWFLAERCAGSAH